MVSECSLFRPTVFIRFLFFSVVQKIAGKHSGFLPHPYFTQNGKVKFVLLLLCGDKNEIKIAMKLSVDPETPKNSLIKNVALIILTFNKLS